MKCVEQPSGTMIRCAQNKKFNSLLTICLPVRQPRRDQGLHWESFGGLWVREWVRELVAISASLLWLQASAGVRAQLQKVQAE